MMHLPTLLKTWDDFLTDEVNRRGFIPPTDIKETENSYVLSIDVPGVPKQNIEIELRGRHLQIRGERKDERSEESAKIHYLERRYGHFERNITLPEGIQGDEAQGHYENGVLTLTIPKAAATKAKKIRIADDPPILKHDPIGATQKEDGAHA